MKDLGKDIREIAIVLLEKASKEMTAHEMKYEGDESIIGALGKGAKSPVVLFSVAC